MYKVPRLAEESNFNQIVRTIRRIAASRVTSPQSLPSANVLQGSPSKHIKSKEEEQNSSNRGQRYLTKGLASCLLFRRKFLEIMVFRKRILKIISSGRYNLPEKEEFEQSCLVDNTILYKPIWGGLTLENLTKVREVPEAGFQDGSPVEHKVLTSNTANLVSKSFLEEHFSIEQDGSHFKTLEEDLFPCRLSMKRTLRTV